jgi:hypothetical protein
MRILNVGSGPVGIDIPPWYDGHDITRLDINPGNEPDIELDARYVGVLGAGSYDVVYCSHTLEHFYPHEAESVMRGFHHVLTDDGACDVFVPDLGALLARGEPLELSQVLYESPAGSVTVHDMLYGYSPYQANGHPEYQAHRSGWSDRRLGGLMQHCGFAVVYAKCISYDLRVVGFKVRPNTEQLHSLGFEVGE